MKPVTPRGFRDRLPEEAAERQQLVQALDATFASWGYGRIETPAVEVASTLEAAAGDLEGTAFRLFDQDGRLLALRPEMTIPVARVAASRLGGVPGPHRFRYAAEVFREHESLRGQARQFTQAGIELIGANGPVADAEIVTVMVEALQAAGLPEFTVAMGTVGLLHSLISAAEMDAEWGDAVLQAAHERNLVALDELSSQATSTVGTAISEVMRIRGGRHAIDQCRRATEGCDCAPVLDRLERTWELLDAAEVSGCVVIDFGVLRQFDYYTGIILEAYAPGLGLPLGGGGRYDRVLSTFGEPAPAAGFALGLDRLQVALVEQGVTVETRGLDAVLGGNAAESFAVAKLLRSAGWRVVISTAEPVGVADEAAERGAAMALFARGGEILRLDRGGRADGSLEQPFSRPPTLGVFGRGL